MEPKSREELEQEIGAIVDQWVGDVMMGTGPHLSEKAQVMLSTNRDDLKKKIFAALN